MSTGQEKREEEEAVSGERRETCHRLGSGSAADAAFVGSAETGGWTGPPGRRAGEEGGGSRAESGAQSHPGRSLLPGVG
ncbi:Tensin-1 [Manis pentadactyla]|nr:Tensin-1 [Manis pentadactyla]